MTCFKPLTGYRSASSDPVTGKRGITFSPTKALIEGGGFRLPCGQCRGCRMDRAQQWMLRCVHESRMHDRSCFITLTYADEHLPFGYSVRKRDWQLFCKRAQKEFPGLRYFGCGEYGDKDGRPHYHGLFFGQDFSADRKLWGHSNGYDTFKSATLERLWPFGICDIGTVTAESAGYVARYCLKKITGEAADEHYFRLSPVDGQLHHVEPEFATMSRRPGLGTSWFDKFGSDAFPSDFLIVDGRKVRPPMFYFRKLEREAEAPRDLPGRVLREELQSASPAVKIKRTRKRFSVQPRQKANATKERLAVREVVHASRVERLKRSL